MFRHPLHSSVRFLMALPFCAAAAPAFAADVNEVSFVVTIARSSEGPDHITGKICVEGTGLSTGTITFPISATPIPLQKDPDGSSCDVATPVLFRGPFSFADETELATLFPAGSYALQVNGTISATIVYDARPAVPSPDISQPGAGQVLPPGPLNVLFTACSVCNFSGDSVKARLEDDAANELASETLTDSDDTWTPPDGIGGDLALPANGDFLVRITHTAVREKPVNVTGNDDPTFKFTGTFIQSDEVGFRTGFPPPEGDFCVVVNDLTPPAGCSPVDDPTLSLLDTGDTISTTVGGHDVDYTFTVDPKGTITGTAMADLDDNGPQETSGTIKGKLKGKSGELKQKLSFPLVNEGLLAKLKVSVSDVLSIPFNSLERVQKASGNLGAVKVKEETLTNGALPVAAQGWRVNFTIDGAGLVQNGLLTLDGGRTFPLEGTHKFNLAKNLSSLKLQTADKGIKLLLKNVELDDETAPTAVVGGDLSYKILGQSGKASLP